MPSFLEVEVQNRNVLSAYEDLIPKAVSRLREDAADLPPITVVHINATAQRGGGGVAEILHSEIDLERELGIDSHWYVIDGAPAAFFDVTKKLHNLLQGKSGLLSEEEQSVYRMVGAELASHLPDIVPTDRRCLVVVHDPQPAAIVSALSPGVPSILRLHIDLSTPNPNAVAFLQPHLRHADRVVVSHDAYLTSMPWIEKERTVISYPAIDPFTDKNRPMALEQARTILGEFGINPDRPLMSQVSRFDPWKDPVGVIRAYYLAKRDVPDLQLALAGFILAKDDPEAVSVFAEIERHASGDPDIFLFADPGRLQEVSNDVFVSAVYTASTVMVQKSIREGFGMTMTEAMWKGRPLVAGNTTGASVQIEHGKNGIIINSPEEAAAAIARLIDDGALREQLGHAAHETVMERFLMPRLVSDFVALYADVVHERA